MTTIFDVENIHCQNCSKKITTAIQAVQPGADVTIDVETHRVSVESVVDEAAIISAIAGAGYEARKAA